MRDPNFFIIGAPKCGTTSLYEWLRTHPRIYMPDYKEPYFFCTDLQVRGIRSRRRYAALFAAADERHLAVGEGSAWYLYSEAAVPNIEACYREPKYIVCVRNPIEMAPSLHAQQILSAMETIEDFAEAWRMSGAWPPPTGSGRRTVYDEKLLNYKEVCSLGAQLERLLRTVPRERVHVVVFDDLRAAPRREYLKVLRFLGVPDDGRRAFPAHNPRQKVASSFWLALLRAGNAAIAGLRLPPLHTGLLEWIARRGFKPADRSPLAVELWEELAAFYRDDIARLERLLDRDLSKWLLHPSARRQDEGAAHAAPTAAEPPGKSAP